MVAKSSAPQGRRRLNWFKIIRHTAGVIAALTLFIAGLLAMKATPVPSPTTNPPVVQLPAISEPLLPKWLEPSPT